MPLTIRLRGEIWHARGFVRVGERTFEVREFSTGARRRVDAEAIAHAREAQIRKEAIEGPGARRGTLTLADCFEAYLLRPGGVEQYDRDRIADLNTHIGARAIDDAAVAWADWREKRGAKLAPGTVARWRAILQAAITAGCARFGIANPPKLAAVDGADAEIVIYLTLAEQDRLLAAYSPNARAVATVLCFAGLRTQEALRLDWRSVDWPRNLILVQGASRTGGARTKTGKGRPVPMHPRVRAALQALWTKAGQPDTGPVFLSARGAPYGDTRGKGGNPLARAHRTACARAGVTGFRVHDWRHHCASWLVMSGVDLFTLMKIMGWTTPRMAQRYVALSGDHLQDAMARRA